MPADDKKERAREIKKMIQNFCGVHLNKEIEDFSMKLCDDLSGVEGVNLSRGKIEIWAASIIYVIARLNFLFDKENDAFITADTLCDFFDAKKSTVGNKATVIEKKCDLSHGAERYCSRDIIDALTFYKTPEGFVIPKNIADKLGFSYEIADADEEESRAIEKFFEDKKKIKEQKALEKKNKRAEINRKIAADKKKKKMENDPQLDLFNDFQNSK
jgi:hypothetical protein